MSDNEAMTFDASVERIVVWNKRGGDVILLAIPPHLQVDPETAGEPTTTTARRGAYQALMLGAVNTCPVLRPGRNVVPADYWAHCEQNGSVQILLRAHELVVAGLPSMSDLTAEEERVAREGVERLEKELASLRRRLPEVPA